MIDYQNLLDKFNTIIGWLYTAFIYSILLAFGSTLGLIVFGLLPSITAISICLNRKLKKELNYPIRDFINEYKRIFIRCIPLSILLVGLFLLVFKNLELLIQFKLLIDYMPLLIATSIAMVISLYILISFLIYFPILLSTFNTSAKKTIIVTFAIILQYPFKNFIIVFMFVLIGSISITIPLLFILFGPTMLLISAIILTENFIFRRIKKII